jgi:hypothetical protein
MMKRSMMMAVLLSAALTFGLSAWAGEGQGGKHGEKHGGGPDQFFAKADTNGDGKLSKEEFAAVCKGGDAEKKFTAADTDKDGFLSKEELNAAHKGPHGGGQCPGGAGKEAGKKPQA